MFLDGEINKQMNRIIYAIIAATIVLPLIVSFGCGRDLPPVAAVSGRVTYKGEPVVQGTIMFKPEHGRPAVGTIGSDGRYTLTTFDSGDGAMLGSHKVMIDAWRAKGNSINAKIEWLVPDLYSTANTSPLKAEVKSGDNTIDFDLPVSSK